MSKSDVVQLKRRIVELQHHIDKLNEKHDRLAKTLQNLNLHYEFGTISYSEYSRLFDAYLGHLSAEKWQKHYFNQINKLRAELREKEQRLKQVEYRKTERAQFYGSVFAALMLVLSLSGLAAQVGLIDAITGAAAFNETAPIPANATVEIFFAVAPSANLTNGIEFGTIQPGTINNNATDNYDTGGMNTSLFIAVSPDSNVNVDFCLLANADLASMLGDKIGITNLTFANATANNFTVPALAAALPMDTLYQDSSQVVSPGSSDFYRFWLDVPPGTPPGAYNNTIIFTAVQESASCP